MEVGTIAGIEKKRTSTVSLTLEGEVTMRMRGVFVADVIRVPAARDLNVYPHLRGVPYHQSSHADILIGKDYGFALRELDVHGEPDEPVAIRTMLGWAVSGPASCETACVSNLISMNDMAVLSYWEEHVELRDDGHYQVPVPWKRVNSARVREPCARSNLDMVQQRYQSLVNKLNADESLKTMYTCEMHRMIMLYAEPVPSERCEGRDYYLPHHGVVHLTKGKMRVVFDCAAKSGGACLNDFGDSWAKSNESFG